MIVLKEEILPTPMIPSAIDAMRKDTLLEIAVPADPASATHVAKLVTLLANVK